LLRTSRLQQGIYYSHLEYPRNSFSIIFLTARPPFDSKKIRETLTRLWNVYKKLKDGIVPDLDTAIKNPHRGNLSVLMGYGPRMFEIDGLNKNKPTQLNDEFLFQDVKLGGDPILPGVGLGYADDISSNDTAKAHFVFQFIGDTQLATNRPIVETWKLLRKIDMEGSSASMVMKSFSVGFNRPDGRGWLGFHDGVSNLRSTERLRNIQIDKQSLRPEDLWTLAGTYMVFLKIAVDLDIWESIPVADQERIVGREKTTGCPLVRVDNRGNNVFLGGCPVVGTREIIEKGNERFREYDPRHAFRTTNPPADSEAHNSHVGRMIKAQARIFRQGFEFLEPINNYPYFRVGLNFVSFQRSSEKVIAIIKHGFGRVNFAGDPLKRIAGADRLLSVRAAGLFLIPPFSAGEEFPGEVAFGKGTSLYRL
jgi:Dyp-type peroxidase family